MRFVISTYFHTRNFNIPAQRLEIKTNELQKAYEICRAFVIGSGSCKMCVWENKNKTKTPDFGALLGVSDASEDNGILTNETNFYNWILNFKERANNV